MGTSKTTDALFKDEALDVNCILSNARGEARYTLQAISTIRKDAEQGLPG